MGGGKSKLSLGLSLGATSSHTEWPEGGTDKYLIVICVSREAFVCVALTIA